MLTIEERARPFIIYTSIFGLVLSSVLFINTFITDEKTDQALVWMCVMLFIACVLACFYKRVVVIDETKKQLTTSHMLFLKVAKRCYSFEDISTIHVRKEIARTQGSDIDRQANKAYTKPLFIVYADLKGFAKGRKRRIYIKKFFNEDQANATIKAIGSIVNEV